MTDKTKQKLKDRMDQCRQIAAFMETHIVECKGINYNDVSTYLYAYIVNYAPRLKGFNLLERILNRHIETIDYIKSLPGYTKYLDVKKVKIFLDADDNRYTEDNTAEEWVTKRIKAPKKARSKESEQLSMAFWFIDQIGNSEQALKVLNAAIAARNELSKKE